MTRARHSNSTRSNVSIQKRASTAVAAALVAGVLTVSVAPPAMAATSELTQETKTASGKSNDKKNVEDVAALAIEEAKEEAKKKSAEEAKAEKKSAEAKAEVKKSAEDVSINKAAKDKRVAAESSATEKAKETAEPKLKKAEVSEPVATKAPATKSVAKSVAKSSAVETKDSEELTTTAPSDEPVVDPSEDPTLPSETPIDPSESTPSETPEEEPEPTEEPEESVENKIVGWDVTPSVVNQSNPMASYSISAVGSGSISLSVVSPSGGRVYSNEFSVSEDSESNTFAGEFSLAGENGRAQPGQYLATVTYGDITDTRSIQVSEKGEVVFVAPQSVKSYESFTINGQNLWPGEKITWTASGDTTYNGGETVADDNGNASIQLSSGYSNTGSITVNISGESGSYTKEILVSEAEVAFTFPNSVKQGQGWGFSGTGLAPNEQYLVQTSNGENVWLSTDQLGNLSGDLVAGSDFLGIMDVTVQNSTGEQVYSGSVRVDLGWTEAKFSLSNDRIELGKTLTISGKGYKPGTEVRVWVGGKNMASPVKSNGSFDLVVSVTGENNYRPGNFTVYVNGKNSSDSKMFEVYEVVIPEPTPDPEPTDPTDPTKPVDPEPTDPEPTDPTKPVDPEPTDPTKPTKPTDPGPTDPGKPVDPEKPTDPVDPGPVNPGPTEPPLINPNPNPGPVAPPTNPDEGGDGDDPEKNGDIDPEIIAIDRDNEQNKNSNDSLAAGSGDSTDDTELVNDSSVQIPTGGVQDAYGSLVIPENDEEGENLLPQEEAGEDDLAAPSITPTEPTEDKDEDGNTIAIQSAAPEKASSFGAAFMSIIVGVAVLIGGGFAFLVGKRRKDEEESV